MATENESVEPNDLKEIKPVISTSLDKFIQILEISFVFLLVYTLITLFEATINEFDLYEPISREYLGQADLGSLRGGQWEEIVRVTLIFNLLLFAISLFFGLWIRRTRDNWTFTQMGFTLNTPNYSLKQLIHRGLVLGLLVLALLYGVMTAVMWYETGNLKDAIVLVHSFSYITNDGGIAIYDSQALKSEYYFGYVEMGIIWPLSAGFFFFAYAHNSLSDKFDQGIANVLATLFYVYYLLFFFMIPDPGKLQILSDPDTWTPGLIGSLLVFFIILYISFSAFAETKSIVLPFLINFVLNVGLTLFKSTNSLMYDEFSWGMLIPSVLIIAVLAFYGIYKRSIFSTVSSGINDLWKNNLPVIQTTFFFIIFMVLSFIVPGILEYVVLEQRDEMTIMILTAILIYVLIIIVAVIVLTYEPTKVYDVLLVHSDGRPISSHIELFQSDDVLISGFFSALGSVSKEISEDKGGLKSIKRGDREIIIEEGVLTKIIALVDRDQKSIRDMISVYHKEFEIEFSELLQQWKGTQFTDGDLLVKRMGDLSIKFNIPSQTRWITTLTMIFAPTMMLFLGLLL